MPIDRPGPDEHHAYYSTYVDRIETPDVLRTLDEQRARVAEVIGGFGEDGSKHRYAPGKWSVKEVLGHLNDTERVFTYRALTFARGDGTELPGMDENAWVAGARFDDLPLAALLEEFAAVRRASLALFAGLDAAELARRGVANGSPMTVRAVPWVLAGHVDHHLAVVRERYARG